MKPTERRRIILNLLHAVQKEWHVKELANELKVSELTVRRDLDKLDKNGGILRTHGGCIASGNGSFSTIFNKEFGRNVELKRAIGKETVKLINPGDTLLLGDGSTTFQVAAHLKNCDYMTIYTNNIAAIQELKECNNIRLYILGGEYDHQFNMLFLKGSLSDRILETLHFNLIIVGTDAISRDGNCMSKTEDVARTNQIILRRGDRKILVADHTKINATANVIYARLSDFDMWVTTAGINEAQSEIFRRQTHIKEIGVSSSDLSTIK